MKIFILLFQMFTARADVISLYCEKGPGPRECGSAVVTGLERLGCAVNAAGLDCRYSHADDPQNPRLTVETAIPYCQVESINCSSPFVGNFGGEDCGDRDKQYLVRSDKIHHGYWFGPFGRYSRTICKARQTSSSGRTRTSPRSLLTSCRTTRSARW